MFFCHIFLFFLKLKNGKKAKQWYHFWKKKQKKNKKRILRWLLLGYRRSAHGFHAIIPEIGDTLNFLDEMLKSDRGSSLYGTVYNTLADLSELTHCLMIRWTGHPELYYALKIKLDSLKQYPPSESRRNALWAQYEWKYEINLGGGMGSGVGGGTPGHMGMGGYSGNYGGGGGGYGSAFSQDYSWLTYDYSAPASRFSDKMCFFFLSEGFPR